MRNFKMEKLVGNVTTLFLIKKALKNGTFRNFTLFGGILGTGKSTCAGITAMALTCEHPDNGLPCLECPTCKMNMAALSGSGSSPRVKVVNLGLKSKFSDVEELINDVFVLQGGTANQVYIFEEVHALKGIKGGFTAFLAEVDRMPDNVYVIMCTTKADSIPQDLKSRAVGYNFGTLNLEESRIMAGNVLHDMNLYLSPEIVDVIVRSAHGIPREIEKLITMAAEDEISLEEMKSYLHVVNDEYFIQVFQAMKDDNIVEMRKVVDEILDKVSIAECCHALEDFLLKVVFYVNAGITDDLTSPNLAAIKQIFTTENTTKVCNLVEGLSKCDNKSELMLVMIKCCAVIRNKPVSSIVANRNSTSAKERVIADRNRVNAPKQSAGLAPLTASALDLF